MKAKIADALRVAYSGPDTAAAIAARFKMSPRAVHYFWRFEKSIGRLADVPRPHFAQHVTVAAEAIDDDDAADIDLNDDAPIGGPLGIRIPSPDPLLSALQAVHGGDCWRPLDGMPGNVLAIEVARVSVPPSPLRCREYALMRDALVAVLMRRQTHNNRAIS